jgi:hypothetical protein
MRAGGRRGGASSRYHGGVGARIRRIPAALGRKEVEEVALNAELGGVDDTERLIEERFQDSPCLPGVDRASILADQAPIQWKN